MPGRSLISALCLLPFMAANTVAMPAAPETASTFANLAALLPCRPDIASHAAGLGYVETAQTQMDTDYVDTEYSDTSGQSHLTVAIESTPIGAQFSVQLDIPDTDQTFADTVVTALRRNWSLPEAVQLQNLASGTAQFWTIDLPNGTTQITVYHDNITTRIFGILAPLSRGAPLPC